jgi:hypothetical protein
MPVTGPDPDTRAGSALKKATLFSLATVVLLGWGAAAFGAEYSWAYAPLLVCSIVVGLLGMLVLPAGRFLSLPLALALGAVVVAVVIQLIPLPRSALAALSPARMATNYGDLWAKATMRATDAGSPPQADHRLSIASSRTVLGLGFLAVLIVLLVGCTRGIGAAGPTAIARGLIALGVAAAVAEIVQRASGTDAVYGFWYPPRPEVHFSAPFINRNHTAGWMVMVLSLSAGHFAGIMARALRGVKRDWRHRMLWLSTAHANEALLTAFAIGMMALSIVATASRSGLACLIFAIMASTWWVATRQQAGFRRVAAAGSLVLLLVVAASWGPIELVFQRFATISNDALTRVTIWHDAMRIIRDFPLSGTGLNTYGIAMLHYQTLHDGQLYIEAHNDYLQLAAEGGLLVGVPVLVAVILFIREVRGRFREGADDPATYWLRVGAVTGLCAMALQESVEFTLQMPGAVVLFVVLAAIAIHRPSPRRRESAVARIVR